MSFDVIVPTKDLVRALGLAGSIVEKRNVLPILGHIKLDAESGALVLTATDMDLSIRQEIGAQVKSNGSIAVPAQTLGEIIKKIPDQEVSLKFLKDGHQLEIASKNCRFTLSSLPASEFPIMEDIGTSHKITGFRVILCGLLEHTKFAMSTEETRYNLNGIYLHALADNPSLLSCAATDGHRLSISAAAVSKKLPAFGVILPRKCVHEILKIVKDPWVGEQDLEIDFGHNRIKFVFGKVTMVSKLIDGSFPEYSNFIPENNPYKLVINSKLLAEVVDRVATVTMDKFRAVKMVFNESGLEVHASGETRGAAHEVVALGDADSGSSYTGAPLSIGFNPRYLLDALSAAGDNLVNIQLHDSFSPTLITSEEFPYTKFVVMPVKV